MEKRNSVNKVVVGKSMSFENEIWFYVSDDTYISTVDNEDGTYCSTYQKLNSGNDEKTATTKNIPLMEIYKKAIFYILNFILMVIVTSFFLSVGNNKLSSCFLGQLVAVTSILIVQFIADLIIYCKFYSLKWKRKHTAENMMCNFIEKYKRLPKSEEEFRKVTRFYHRSSEREMADEYVANFIIRVVILLLGYMLVGIISYVIGSNRLQEQTAIMMYIILAFDFQTNNKVIEACIEPFRDAIGYIFQFMSTTKKIEKNDIDTAYLTAKYWMIIVYPELYKKKEESKFVFTICKEENEDE